MGKNSPLNEFSMQRNISSQANLIEYRVIALISANIVPSWDIEGSKLASVRRYPNEGQYSPISVRKTFYYIAINTSCDIR